MAELPRQPPRACAQFEGVQCRRLVDEHRRILHLAHGVAQADEIVLGQPSGPQPLLVDPPGGTDQTHHQLLGTHLHAEHGHRQLLVHGHVFADVQCKGRFPHRRTGRHDDQIPRLHAGGHPVQIDETGGNAGDLAGVVAAIEFVDALEHLARQRTDVLEIVALLAAVLGNLEHLGLGRVQYLVDRPALGIEGFGGDLVRHGNQPAQHGPVAHHLGIVADVAGRDHRIGEHHQILLAPGIFQTPGQLQRILDRQRIGRLAGPQQDGDVLPYQTVIMAVEVIIVDDVGNVFPGTVVEQQTAQHRLFGFDRMRRQPQLCNFAVHEARIGRNEKQQTPAPRAGTPASPEHGMVRHGVNMPMVRAQRHPAESCRPGKGQQTSTKKGRPQGRPFFVQDPGERPNPIAAVCRQADRTTCRGRSPRRHQAWSPITLMVMSTSTSVCRAT